MWGGGAVVIVMDWLGYVKFIPDIFLIEEEDNYRSAEEQWLVLWTSINIYLPDLMNYYCLDQIYCNTNAVKELLNSAYKVCGFP